MASRTQVVCLHEGVKGRSIDPIFIRALLKRLDPAWLRPWKGSNVILTKDCGGRVALINRMPVELKTCLQYGADTTLMVWADVDDDVGGPDQLKAKFWEAAKENGVTREEFDQVVFAFAQDRLENWIEFLMTGVTDESKEGPRVRNGADAAKAAELLARRCAAKSGGPKMPPSLAWSCENWRKLVRAMTASS